MGWAIILMRLAKKNRSPALYSNAQHLMTDVWTGCALVIGVLLIPITHMTILDEVIGSIVVLLIIKSGWNVVCDSISGLTDEAPSDDVMRKIREIIVADGTGAIEAHHIRTRVVGPLTFLDFHLVVDSDMTVRKAHDICDRIEASLTRTMGNMSVSIHIEPETHQEPNALRLIIR